MSKKIRLFVSATSITLFLFFIEYQPTLFRFFMADDFVYIKLVSKTLQDPALLWKIFFTPIPITYPGAVTFYRPFLSAMLFFEGKIWGLNAIYFRSVNMVIELLCGLMLGSLVMALNTRSNKRQSQLGKSQLCAWAFLSGTFFIFYPLHSEPVNWIAARMDPLVTLFILFSLWCHIRWCHNHRTLLYLAGIISGCCAFLTKEMAVVLPPLVTTYGFLFRTNSLSLDKSIVKRLYAEIITASPYWFMLVLYFFMRKFILGSFIGGYSYQPGASSLTDWLSGLSIIFVPINKLIFSSHHPIFATWYLCLSVLVLFVLAAIVKTKRHEIHIVQFLIIWFFLSLIPLFKVFPAMMTTASGSRIAYLATAPLCILLSYGVATFAVSKNNLLLIARFFILCFLALTLAVLYSNNLAWAQAGRLNNQFLAELEKYSKKISDSSITYISGLPIFSEKGIGVCLGLFPEMLGKPFINTDLFQTKRLDTNDPHVNVGFLKDTLEHNTDKVKLLYWDSLTTTLKTAEIPPKTSFVNEWKGNDLKKIVHIPVLHHISDPTVQWLNSGSITLDSRKKGLACTIVDFDLNQLCWYIDFLGLKVKFDQLQNTKPFGGVALFFKNYIAKEFTAEYFRNYFVPDSCRVPITLTNKEQDIIFCPRKIPEWIAGGKCKSVRIIFPASCNITISKIWVPELTSLMPVVRSRLNYNHIPGEMSLDSSHDKQYIDYDAQGITGCTRTVLEIVKAEKFFERVNSKDGEKLVSLKRTSAADHGTYVLNLSDFASQKGVYKARLMALDKTGNQLGFPSDSFSIIVN